MPAMRVQWFDTWRPGYGLATVRILQAGTSVLASVYLDEELTQVASNPQTLLQQVDGGISYGRFSAPLYVGVPILLEINAVDRTGIQRPPLTTLEDADASLALVTPTGASEAITVADHLARRIDVRDYGEFIEVGEQGASTATNTASLTSAIGIAGSLGGGFVELPSGTYRISAVTVPEGVVLRGQGIAATVIQSTTAGNVVTIEGQRAGLSRLTLDGISLATNSVGVYSHTQNALVLDETLIKRFDIGVQRLGGSYCEWDQLTISNCNTGYKAYGDDSDGDAPLNFNIWRGGGVDTCATIGIDLKNDGDDCTDNVFEGLFFDSNLAKAVNITGAKSIQFLRCRWQNNTNNLTIADVDATTTVSGIEIRGGAMEDGTVQLTGTLEQIAFRHLDIDTVTVTITSPSNAVLVEDCTEASNVVIAGDATAWARRSSARDGTTFGVTVGNAPTKAWAITLDPGEHVFLEAKVIGRQRNAVGHAFYFIGVSARRPGASLAYDTQTSNFTAGLVITGGTSGATARIQADSDSGTTGTLTLIDVVGTFVDNEIITDTSTGSATVNGSLSTSNAALVGTVAAIRAAQETDATWDATFAANGPQIELTVTGASAKTIEWTSDVTVTR